MFDPKEIPELKAKIQERAREDFKILEELREDMRKIKHDVRVIKPRSATAVSLVASDGGNNSIVFDPFFLQLVRVVDSYGKKLFLDVITPTTDTDELSAAQFNEDGSPRTALGYMMKDIGVKPLTLNQLSHMIPTGKEIREKFSGVNTSWVQVYRDLCEWAVLYDRICNHQFATDTLIVRDGQLRSKLFRGEYFIRFRENIEKRIKEIYERDRRKVYLVGIAKRSKVISRYQLAMMLENVFPDGEPRYVRVPRDLEKKVYIWSEYARGAETTEGEAPKFVAGDMYLVRFGKRSGDPIWAVDILSSQTDQAQEILGYLLSDAIDGFPVPLYPRCLQKAHEHAQVVGFDLDILQDQIYGSVKEALKKEHKDHILEMTRLTLDVSARRYE
ncbi:hypothetical protein [Parageobacillus thermoglucosidasius]|uniref:hypothetical protein n=1 Tax=Parageobacillus thermoglucosidasius TaxID=1426 RepID=UPI000B576166|nr:hypothetical protein [Parageobacillus thermoglucosidasius]OUM93460.1 MAG: hypothetical protein BAA00_11015 [Parageobacillus thermoglucosidasius]